MLQKRRRIIHGHELSPRCPPRGGTGANRPPRRIAAQRHQEITERKRIEGRRIRAPLPSLPLRVRSEAWRLVVRQIIRRAERWAISGASHPASPIVGLHCRTKGANRTILDCVFCLLGKDKWSSAAVGRIAGVGFCFRSTQRRDQGCQSRLQIRKGWDRDDNVFGGTHAP
jgi:hypothetical protein